MKTLHQKKLVSLLLVVCMLVGLVGLFPALSFAASTSASGTYVKDGSANSSGITQVLLYRNFEDGKTVVNGCTNNNADVEIVTSGTNSYYRYNGNSSDHTYLVYSVGTDVPKSGSLVFQFDIMFESLPRTMGSIFQVNPVGRGGSGDVYTPGQLTSKKWTVPGLKTTTSCGNTTTSETTYSSTLSANTWYTVTYVFSGNDMVNSTSVSCYFNGSALCSGDTAYVDTSDSSTGCTDVRPGEFRFGGNSTSSSYCIDDIFIYTTSTTDAATAAGYTVNTSGGSTGTYYNPYGSTNVNPDAYNGNAFFKVGATNALTTGNVKKTGIAAPFTANGNVYIPTSSLTTVMGSAPAGATETVNGISCVNVANISTAYSGYYGDYCSMGLISISTTNDLIKDGAELSMISVMQKFLFDNISTSLTNNNSFSVDDMNSLDHPYLYANQTRFDELAEVWAAGQAGEEVDETLYSYIDNRVSQAQRIYEQYAQKDASGNYSAMNTTVNLVRGYQNYIYNIPYQSVNSTYPGYDVGGRLGDAETNNQRILLFAYAYQITKDINYAKLAYQYAIYMGQWEHWGPGHFLNVADAASPYAIAYDWLYDAWKELETAGATYQYCTNGTTTFETRTVSVAAIEEILFTHGLIPAFYSINGANNYLPWRSSASGWNFHTRTNNWNAVCSAGTSVAALALVGNTTATSNVKIDVTVNGVYSADTAINKYPTNNTAVHTNYSTYQDYAEFIVNEALYNLPIYGMEQYVPDGSYIESNGYWSYGTNNVYELVAALTTTTGSDFGLLDTWGMDRTVYYALNTMSSDGNGWNYHDSNSIGAQDTSWFMYLANDEAMGYRDLAGIRKDLNATVKQDPSYYDAIFYLSDEEIGSFTYPELEYYMEGIDGYVVRDSWNQDEGTLYAAFMGNTNNLSHGQIDSGAFVYYNKGTRWFLDLGTEEYNAAGFWGTGTRYRYYAMGAEGNNDLIVTDEPELLPHGQSINGFGSLYAHGNNDFGAYAIIDNNSAYSGVTTSAKRGMFFTNDRKTTVIQDEVVFASAHDVAWIAHTSGANEIMLSVDGKTAYLSNGNDTIKVTLIDKDNQGLKFSITGCGYDYRLLENTFENNYSINNGGVAQKSYDGYQRLVVIGENVTKFNVAVVIEEVIAGETMNDAQGVGYTWTDMDSWTPYEDDRTDGSVGGVDSSVIANVTVTTPVVEETEPGDTPIVDLFDTMWPAAAAVQAVTSGGETTEYAVESFEELESLINSNPGCEITVDLYDSNKTPISITSACTVNTNGNKLLATSNTLVANVSGNTVKYESGSVTVTWILAGGAVVNETYTGSVVAQYKGTITEGTTIYEVDNGDGTYSYYTSGNVWSVTENGKQSSANEFIVTSQNNVFYQVGKEFEGLFVTVKGNTVTGYYSANDFFTANILSNTQYDRISITNDFGYDATAKSDVHATGRPINLYLNGNTITYTTTENEHMFQVNGGTMNVYGPGSLRSEATQANIFYNDTSAGDDINAYNVDFYSVRAITDLRCNTATFKNCNVTIENKNNSAFTVINRNNAAAVDPYLIVDGCTINMPAFATSSSVFSLRMDAKAEITGGTTIITATDGTLFSLENSLVSTVEGFDFTTSYQQMYAIIGDIYHNLSTLSKSGTNDPSGATYDLSGRVFYGNGYVSETAPDANTVLTGCVVAKVNETLYTVCAEDECATVWWCDENGNDITSAEYWVAGSTPVANSTIKGSITVPTGKMLVFDTETVEGSRSYYFNAKIIDKFGLQINMSLHSDFNLNFYVQNVGAMTFKIDGKEVTDVDTTSYSGYYKVTKHGINPSVAGKAVTLEVTYGGSTISKSISPMDYAARLLESNQSAEANAMMVNIIKYTEAAYVYTGNNFGENSTDYAKVVNLYNKYKSLATVSIVNRQGVDMSAVTDAISGAQLNLAESPKFRFNLKETYTGTVTIGDKTFDVENGICRGKTYIELTNKAYDLIGDIVITTAKGTATYSLANYYYYEVTEQGAIANLLNALYAYCETAVIYQAQTNA